MTTQTINARPRPRISPDNAPFWNGCAEGRLLLPTCVECGKPHLPPGPVCPFCFSDRLDWREAAGTGKIASFVVVHKAWFASFAADVPYNVVLIELDEGPRLTASITGDGAALAVGTRVRATFEKVDQDLTLVRFAAVEVTTGPS